MHCISTELERFEVTYREHRTVVATVFEFTCGSCGMRFHASGICDFIYGAFVMRTRNGEEAVLEAVTSPTFAEFVTLANTNPALAEIDEGKRHEVLQAAFTVACDFSESGEEFYIGLNPTCPQCASREMASWKAVTSPRRSVIPLVTHSRWDRLSDSEKCVAVNAEIRRNIRENMADLNSKK